ncbi:MFS transporter [Tsukamurella sp. PLM1]|uniref:MFS transporter n=1 Tax=Tsukamurella sp. PLM1 TaxID=2929795 RepID=UPI002049B24B|nr:MFS transporter [Tsukamurella sp. PLM1]BDH55071.1 MFS transporter [Tsukamurella sp. PLM1]
MTTLDSTPELRKIPRYERWRFQIFGVTWLAYAGFYFTRQAFSVAKLGILEDPVLGETLTKSVLGTLDAVYLAAYAAGQFIWGAMSDRFGPRKVVLGGLLMSAVATVFIGVLPALVFLVPLMIVQGLSQSTGWSGLLKNMAQFFSIGERGRVFGLWSTNYAFGGLVAAPFLGWVAYDLFGNWRVAFFTGAAVVLAVAVLFFLFQRNTPTDVGLPRIEDYHSQEAALLDAHAQEEAPSETEEPRASLKETVRFVLGNRMVLILGACYFLLKPARYAILLWGPVIVSERLVDASAFTAITVPVAFGVAGVVAPILIGQVSDRVFHARRVPACVISLAVLVVALAAFAPLTATGNMWVMVAILAVIGLSIYGADAMISCVAAVDFGTSKHAGTVTGAINGCGSVGAILGGLLPGLMGAGALFTGFSVAAAVAMLLLLPMWRHMPNAE